MMMQIQVQVPDYFTLKHYKSLQYLKDIEDEIERKLMTVAVFTNRSYDDVMNWNVNSIIESLMYYRFCSIAIILGHG